MSTLVWRTSLIGVERMPLGDQLLGAAVVLILAGLALAAGWALARHDDRAAEAAEQAAWEARRAAARAARARDRDRP